MRAAATRFEMYWRDAFKIIKGIRVDDDRMHRLAASMLELPELPAAGLGFSRGGVSGSGIGKEIAHALLVSSRQIIDIGITDPTLFELAGLFETGIAADRLSDMVIHITAPQVI